MLSRAFSLLGLISSLRHLTPSILSTGSPARALQRLTIDEAHCQFRIIGLRRPVCQFERAKREGRFGPPRAVEGKAVSWRLFCNLYVLLAALHGPLRTHGPGLSRRLFCNFDVLPAALGGRERKGRPYHLEHPCRCGLVSTFVLHSSYFAGGCSGPV